MDCRVRVAFACQTALVQMQVNLLDAYLDAWADPEVGQGVQTHPGIARLLIFAMLKFSLRPLLGMWTPPEKTFWIRACDVHEYANQNKCRSLKLVSVLYP